MLKYLTKEGLEKIKKELDHLKTVKRRELAETLKLAVSFGDLKENFAYHQAKEDQGFLEGRILELEEIIRGATIIEKDSKRKGDKVQVGSIVIVSSNNNKQTFQVVASEEADPKEAKLSLQSPLGKAVLGKSIDETF